MANTSGRLLFAGDLIGTLVLALEGAMAAMPGAAFLIIGPKVGRSPTA